MIGSMNCMLPGHSSRRSFTKLAGLGALGLLAKPASPATVPLFDGKTLEGWTQIENNATSLRSEAIRDLSAFIGKLASAKGAVAEYLRSRLSPSLVQDLTSYSP